METHLAPWILLAAIGSTLAAQPQPTLLKDINQVPLANPSSGPQNFVRFGAHVYFSATTNAVGDELFRSDGTAAGTTLFADLWAGASSSGPHAFTVAGGRLFFVASVPVGGSQLYVTDGTAAGTLALRSGVNGVGLMAFNNKLVFTGSDAASGFELWQSDGTIAGTTRIIDLNPGPAGSFPLPLGVHGGYLYFTASDGQSGLEPWRTDGTPAGTTLVKDTVAGSNGTLGTTFGALGSDVYFGTTTGFNSFLWKSNGTPAGTIQLHTNASAFLRGALPGGFTPLGNALVFVGPNGLSNTALWRTDGTVAGTQVLRSWGYGGPSSLYLLNTAIYFVADLGINDGELWRTDGTVAGTTPLKDIWPGSSSSSPRYLTLHQGELWFQADDGAQGAELWRSNGTAAGTVLAYDLLPGANGSRPYQLTADSVGGQLWFGADDGSGFEPWTASNSSAQRVVDLVPAPPGNNSSGPNSLIQLGGVTLFNANDGVNGPGIWRTDGTPAGTFRLASGYMAEPVVVGDHVFYFSNGLWKTDGTAAGTTLVSSSGGTRLTAVGSTLFFGGGSSNGFELWKSDGTAAGTVEVKDIRPGPLDSDPNYLTAVGSQLFFAANNGVHGFELWKSDGTAAGTTMVLDLAPGSDHSAPDEIAAFDGAAWFLARSPAGRLLWRTDGTGAGTVPVSGLGPNNTLAFLTVAQDKLLFFAPSQATGIELWAVDAGTISARLVKDIEPGPLGSSALTMTAFGSRALLSLAESVHGFEPWITDGTAAGTTLVKDLLPGDSAPGRFYVTGSRYAHFDAFLGGTTRSMVVTDGTAAGTLVVAQPQVLLQHECSLAGGKLVFPASLDASGYELWMLDPGASAKSVGQGCGQGTRVPTLNFSDPALGQTVTMSGENAVPGAAGFVLLSPGPSQPLNRGSGCWLYVNPTNAAVLYPFFPAQPRWSVSFPMPQDPQLSGIHVNLQAVFGPTGAPQGIDYSNGVLATIGL